MKTTIPRHIKICATLLMFFLPLFFGGCSQKYFTIDSQDLASIDISKKDANLEPLGKMLLEEGVKEPFILFIPNAYELPVNLELKTPVAHMKNESGVLVFDRDVYLYVSQEKILISPNKTQWARIEDMEEAKQLFGAGKGELKIGMGATKEDGARLIVAVTLHPAI